MNIVLVAINKLNPGQLPITILDQPLYALAKQVQRLFPDLYGGKKIEVFFGGLHTEMATLKLIEQWLQDNGWAEQIVRANITSSKIAESYLKGIHVTHCRLVHTLFGCQSIYIDAASTGTQGAALN